MSPPAARSQDPEVYGTIGIRPQRRRDPELDDEPEDVVQAPRLAQLLPADVHQLGPAGPLPQGLREEQLLERQVGPVHDQGRLLRDTVSPEQSANLTKFCFSFLLLLRTPANDASRF